MPRDSFFFRHNTTKIMILRFLTLLLLLAFSDITVYLGIRRMFTAGRSRAIKRFKILFWALSVGFLMYFIVHACITGIPGSDPIKYRSYFVVFAVFVLLYIPKLIAATGILLDDLLHLIVYCLLQLMKRRPKKGFRAFFGSYRLLSYTGIVAGILLFFITLYGITAGKTNFRVKEVSITFPDLPASFDGFRIAQLSDLHLGSFYTAESVYKGIALLKDQQPDCIVMTGDLVNTSADEATPYIELFKDLNPSGGKYSVLGNHDMGDYMKWDTIAGQTGRTAEVAAAEKAMGFTVLRNAHCVLRRGSDSIIIAGVDNWGLPPFRKYGRLDSAMAGISRNAFTLLLSHDPTHWKVQVAEKTNIALTLSGHTHAFQLGIDYGQIRWSPIFLKYSEYLGLYQCGSQFLYVNPGFGFIGFAGRIGTPPEITLITLRKKS